MATSLHKGGKLITCILPKGQSREVMQELSKMGVTRYSFAYARGTDVFDLATNKKIIEVEKEILTVIAENQEEGDDLFDKLYSLAKINRLGGGIMYMTSLSGATDYKLS